MSYAPDEQLRLGLVAPHSDLYALAVTALVLMTGKKPQQLLNQNTLQWDWEQYLKLNPLLTRTIYQMLAVKPTHRFQSAEDISEVLSPIFPIALSKRYSGQSPIPAAVSRSLRQVMPPDPTESPNGSQSGLPFLKQKWHAIPRTVKFLLPALLVLAGVVYVSWKNHLFFTSQPIPTEISRVSDLQLRDSMKEVQNVPSGLFNYGGAHTFAVLTAHGMNDSISRAHPEFRLRYTEPLNEQPGSGTGIQMLLNGELTLAQSARPLEENDHKKAKTLGFSLEQVPIAIDGVAFYTHPNLSIPGLSIDQLQAIFRGKVTNWRQVGGPDLPIVPLALDPKITSVLKLLLGGEGNDIGSNVQIVRDYTTAIRKVAATPGGISYGSAPIFATQKSIRAIALAKANTKQYVRPFTENRQINAKAFLDGTYPMTRRLFIVFRRDRSVDETAAVAYSSMLLSKEGQKIVEQAGFVPIH